MRCRLINVAALLGCIPSIRSQSDANIFGLAHRFSMPPAAGSHVSKGLPMLHVRGGASGTHGVDGTEDHMVEENSEEEYDEYDLSDEEGDASVSEVKGMDDYLEPYFMSPSVQLYATFGCMILGKKIDMFSPLVVKLIRFAFIAQILVQQLFILYVRLAAKRKRDMTTIEVRNPMSDVLTSQLQLDGNARTMIKKLSSSFLSSETTMMDYDLKQASNMQGGVILTMGFMWFLHFKLDKVQPLLIQVCMGLLQLIYSPLFQVYVLGRNLERPFKNPSSPARTLNFSGEQSNQAAGTFDNLAERTLQTDDTDKLTKAA